MKKLLYFILKILSRRIIKKYKPVIVGITGSIGKTSAKEATYAVLCSHFNVRQNIKNYNNEIGVPLTIIGAETGSRSIVLWLKVFAKALSLLIKHDVNYPEILILEMGADKPGDIEYLVEIAPPTIGVVTKVGPTHLEFFGSVDEVAKEKQKIVTCLNKENFAVLNFDDALVMKMGKKVSAKVMTFGFEQGADVRAIEMSNRGQGLNTEGLNFKVQYQGSSVPMFLPGVIGSHQINAALVACAVGLSLGMDLIQISRSMANYHAPKGRMNLLLGIKNSLIIDDTYNSSPDAAKAAIESVAKFSAGRKVAILGDMLELGEITDKAHFELGHQVAQNGFNVLMAVGKNRLQTVKGARENGLSDCLDFENSVLASQKIADLINENDVILVKGSQGSRMERIVRALLPDQSKADELLVRQGADWIDK